MPETATLHPGDVLTCSACGARSRPLWHTGAQYREGWPLLLTWEHGPEPRTFVENSLLQLTPPFDGRCCWCRDEGRVATADMRIASCSHVAAPVPDEWIATPGATVPDWLVEIIGPIVGKGRATTTDSIIEKWGEGARFNRRVFTGGPRHADAPGKAGLPFTPTPPPAPPAPARGQLSLL